MMPGAVRSLGASSPSPAPGLQESSGSPAPGAWLSPRCIHPYQNQGQNPTDFCGHPGELHRLILGCEGASSATSWGGHQMSGLRCAPALAPPRAPVCSLPRTKTPHFGLFLHIGTLPRGCLEDVLMVQVLGFGVLVSRSPQAGGVSSVLGRERFLVLGNCSKTLQPQGN